MSESELLRELVSRPSVSGEEPALGAWVVGQARGWGLSAACDETGVRIEVRGASSGPTLALVSHLDTVPPGEGWTKAPFDPVIVDGRLFGRGSGDAKASVAAMVCAAADVARAGGPVKGRLLVLLGYGEETRKTTMGRAVAAAGAIDAAIVGEPTSLDFAVAQRGLMVVELIASGEQRHAGHSGGGNAILALAQDLLRLEGLFRNRAHPLLGYPSVTPTMLEAGVGRNVTPPRAKALLDVRSTPEWPHAELAEGLRAAVEGEVTVLSDRLAPCATPEGSRLLGIASKSRPGARTVGSPTSSDWVFLSGCDAFKCGPGDSRLSHGPDECVSLDEVREARVFYAAVAKAYLS